MSISRLACVLALTALPVAVTSIALRLLTASDVAAVSRAPRAPYLDFAVYAAANWITFALVVRLASWTRLRSYGLRLRVTPSRCIGSGVGFLAGLLIYTTIDGLLPRIGLPPVRGMDLAVPTPVGLLSMVASVVVTAAFCEEVFFRVLWIGALRRHVPTWAAVILSIAAFAAIHYPYFGPGGVVFISVWALVPVALFIWFEECTASTAMHVMNNAFAYLLVPLLVPVAT